MNNLFEYESCDEEGNYFNCKLKRNYGRFKEGQEFVKIKIKGRLIELHLGHEAYKSLISTYPTFESHI